MADATRPSRSVAQWFCLVAGAVLMVRGVVGFFGDMSFDLPGEGWHTVIHFATGIALMLAARDLSVAPFVAFGFAALYGSIALIGTINGHEVLGVIPIQGGDNVIHTIYAAVALAAAVVSGRVRRPGRAEPAA
jgi:hypothetical protein